MAAALRILLVEDDLDVAASLGDFLEAAGVQVDFAYNTAQALARVDAATFDVLVLDVNLPDGDGFSLCQQLRTRQGLATPVVFLTARDELTDKLQGFAAGAVDYVVKPFAPQELLARLRALSQFLAQASGGAHNRLHVGEFALDLSGFLLRRGEQVLPLSATGFTILKTLMSAYPGTVATAELGHVIWGDESPESDPLRAHIHQLRQQLLQTFASAPIETVRGVGYRFSGS